MKGQTPESGIPPSDRATRRYTKIHLDFWVRFSTLIGQIGRVPLFGAGPRRYIRSRLFRLPVTVFSHALTASWRQKGKREQVFPRAIRTTELPSNPSPLTLRNNQIQILETRNHGSQRLSASYQHTRHVVVTRTHAHTTRDKGTKALTVVSGEVRTELPRLFLCERLSSIAPRWVKGGRQGVGMHAVREGKCSTTSGTSLLRR